LPPFHHNPHDTHPLPTRPTPNAAFPRAPLPLLAAVFAPFAWLYGRPDLFDSYSVGILLMQMAVPQLRSSGNVRTFNSQLSALDHDLDVGLLLDLGLICGPLLFLACLLLGVFWVWWQATPADLDHSQSRPQQPTDRPTDPPPQAWRARQGRNMDFSQLERSGGAGWDLAKRLLAKRDKFNRGRMSVEEALGHRYLAGGLFGG
jgi:hypothetical protein